MVIGRSVCVCVCWRHNARPTATAPLPSVLCPNLSYLELLPQLPRRQGRLAGRDEVRGLAFGQPLGDDHLHTTHSNQVSN